MSFIRWGLFLFTRFVLKGKEYRRYKWGWAPKKGFKPSVPFGTDYSKAILKSFHLKRLIYVCASHLWFICSIYINTISFSLFWAVGTFGCCVCCISCMISFFHNLPSAQTLIWRLLCYKWFQNENVFLVHMYREQYLFPSLAPMFYEISSFLIQKFWEQFLPNNIEILSVISKRICFSLNSHSL